MLIVRALSLDFRRLVKSRILISDVHFVFGEAYDLRFFNSIFYPKPR